MLTFAFLMISVLAPSAALPVPIKVKREAEDTQHALEYFSNFGYTQSMSGGMLGEIVDPDTALESALTSFQKVWHLPVTGQMDEATKELMSTDRCGNRDDTLYMQMQGMAKRYHIVDEWRGKRNFTYKITRYSKNLTVEQVDHAAEVAFNLWAQQSLITFRKTTGQPDIEIFFARRDHGDAYPFDGKGGTLAHAFYPYFGGDLHIDDDEPWTYFNSEGKEITQSMTHEFGHSMGLDHSSESGSIMNPFYKYRPNLKLATDDILGIQALYGQPSQTPGDMVPVLATTTEEMPSIRKWCKFMNIDAAFFAQDGEIYLFQNDEVAVYNRRGIKAEYPIKTSVLFPEVKGKVDASFLLPTVYACLNKKTFTYFHCMLYDVYIFQKDNFIRYRNGQLKNFGKIASIFPGLPSGLDSAFSRNDGKLYFTKGELLYKVSRGSSKMDAGYPKKIQEEFPDLPPVIDGALTYVMQYKGEDYYANYFFSDTNYFLITQESNKVSGVPPAYPRPIAVWWLQCEKQLGELKNDSNPLLQAASNMGKQEYWASEVSNFEPSLPKSRGFFDKDNNPLELDESEVSVFHNANDVLVNEQLDPNGVDFTSTTQTAAQTQPPAAPATPAAARSRAGLASLETFVTKFVSILYISLGISRAWP